MASLACRCVGGAPGSPSWRPRARPGTPATPRCGASRRTSPAWAIPPTPRTYSPARLAGKATRSGSCP
eukprot:9123451-Lingulodinium_polyedra.AAC.1